ncbi:MAG: non-canonical purine NTP pyrophosphatase, partial [Chloroflexota bacterium]
GVHSRRWAGDVTDAQRNAALLERLLAVPDALRTGRFRCTIALAEGGRDTVLVEGRCEGHIAWQPRGEHGFGYDPLFQPDGLRQTLGEVPADVKNRLSHRARAARLARDVLRQRATR